MSKDIDTKTLKSLIVALRNSGMTYQNISDKLKTEYGVERTRQSIQGMYARAMDEGIKQLSVDDLSVTCDIVNIYCLGYKMTQIVDAMAKLNVDVTYRKITTILEANNSYIQNVERALKLTVYDAFDNEDNPDNIKAQLDYKGISIKESKFNSLVADVAQMKVKKYELEQYARVYKITGDRETVKELCKKADNISVKDVEIEMRP